MRTQTFSDWLRREVESSRMALVRLYESRDRLLYVEAPPLRQKYMSIIGTTEEPVLQAELEVAMLQKKAEMIQAAINRREPVNLEEIDAKLEEERQREISRLEDADLTLHELPQLTEEESRTLQRQYREITGSFHPAVNASLTEAQKELYQKAVEAYRMQDVGAMRVIYDSLFSPVDLSGISISAVPGNRLSTDQQREEYREYATALSTDYLLAKTLFDCFAPLEEDGVILDTLRGYDRQRREVEEEISQIRKGFPFNAAETMNDPVKTREYLAELQIRAKRCELEKTDLQKRIAEMTEDRKHV